MNERIIKLVNETTAWCDQNCLDHELYNQIWEEKFAELIVNKCCQKLEDDGMVEVAMEIKSLFGFK